MSRIDNPHIALPVRFIGGRLAVVEQDSHAHVFQRIETTLRYEPGDLETLPEFGRRDQAFRRGGPDVQHIADAVERWVPDAPLAVERDPDGAAHLAATVRIDVYGTQET
jgi:hypothetical protein